MADMNTLARPYAKAAFEFALQQDKLSDWSQMLTTLAQVTRVETVEKLLHNPAMTTDQKAAVLLELCQEQLTEDGQNFIKALSDNRRLPLLPVIAELYEALKAEREKTVVARVTSAYELSSEQQKTLADALSKRLDLEVVIETEIDESLIGGVIIRTDDIVIDGSVRGKLAKLAEALNS